MEIKDSCRESESKITEMIDERQIEQISPEDAVEVVREILQQLNNEDFTEYEEILYKINEIIKSCKTNILNILGEAEFYPLIHNFINADIENERISAIIDTVCLLLVQSCDKEEFLELIPQFIFEDLFLLLQNSGNSKILQRILQCFDNMLLVNKRLSESFAELGLISILLDVESKYSELTRFWSNDPYITIECCCLATISRLYFNVPKLFDDEITHDLINRYMEWINQDDYTPLLTQSIRGLAIIANDNAQILNPIISVTEYNHKFLKYIRYSDQEIVRSTLDLIYYLCAEMPEYFDLGCLQNNIKQHLQCSSSDSDPIIPSISCRILAIYFSYESNHELLISEGIVELVIKLMNGNVLEYKTEATIALANLICTATTTTLEFLFQKYDFIHRIVELLEIDHETLNLAICHTIIKILDAAKSGSEDLSEVSKTLVQEIDPERISELSNAVQSATAEIAERILAYLDVE
ncbi:hypothetical protein TVAG_137730 [Trichomonas vaginalis G3]|uniref:Uncharacterized protein n=1 Tax=Trichomonas vaginalis (strain ATCC PRA-98 / G3) TaxID=412133 RepID=A2EC08_TRIV3|nr:armadillo (ARM) repeat-containing protein family [Trichomonas vaginalis G3]EAY09783.1 hypothetical protein TVAG_137730 [Trichomonas vaginalis G3]KAI5525735.1 armadillo (ARM) repeat-containing protein family [Trichomonas vaginalis G3]|eukprot:XP_001322006.1 hypothetical protein [Trichomonas vaginalis G3]